MIIQKDEYVNNQWCDACAGHELLMEIFVKTNRWMPVNMAVTSNYRCKWSLISVVQCKDGKVKMDMDMHSCIHEGENFKDMNLLDESGWKVCMKKKASKIWIHGMNVDESGCNKHRVTRVTSLTLIFVFLYFVFLYLHFCIHEELQRYESVGWICGSNKHWVTWVTSADTDSAPNSVTQSVVLIYFDLSWFILIYLDLFWFILIYFDLSWFILIYLIF